MKLEPKICGLWDGCGLWVQWAAALPLSGSAPAPIYELQLRYRVENDKPWGDWITTVPPQGEASHWGVIPTWKEGWQFQGRARCAFSGSAPADLSGGAEPENSYELAAEVTFTQCSALFEISSASYEQHFPAGTVFHAQVDGAACAYESREALQVLAGESQRTRLYATGASGYFQLDHEDHFDVKPTFGVRVRNVEASVEDLAETGRDFTVIAPKPMPDRVTMAVSPKTSF